MMPDPPQLNLYSTWRVSSCCIGKCRKPLKLVCLATRSTPMW